MSKDSVADWSTTASDNTDVGGIAVTNTQTADKIDDIVREVMAQVATAVADNTLYTPDVVSSATTSAQGIVELATVAEALAGTDAVRAVTPNGLYYPTGHLFGLTLSNGTDATNDIDIATGTCRSLDDTANMALASILTKQLDAAWAVGTNAGGLDTGSIANTTYHVWLIKRSDTGVVDALFSTSASAPTMPTNYDLKRRIGSIVRTGAAIKTFIQTGDTFSWLSPAIDINATAPGTSAVTRTLTLPVGIRVEAILTVAADPLSSNFAVYISDLSQTDLAVQDTDTSSLTLPTTISGGVRGTGLWISAMTRVFTNTSAQVRSRCSASGASNQLGITTHGWVDTRGRAA